MRKAHLYIIFTITSFVLCVQGVYGQDDCVLKLQDAERLYDEGKIEKVPDLLKPCIKNGFNRENKIQALKLLTQVYLFEDKNEEAEETLLEILKMDPEYKVNKSVDAVDYIRLYKLFNTDPIFSLGGVLGFNNTYPILMEPVGTNAFDSINANYTSDGVAISIGIRATYHVDQKIEITFEPSYVNSKYSFSEDVTSYEYNTGSEEANFISLPLYGTYSFYNYKQSKFFAELGFAYGLFISGTQEVTSNYVDNVLPSTPTPKFSTNELRKKNNFSGSLGLGTKINLNRSYLQFAVRYKFGFNNIVADNLVNSDNTKVPQWNNYQIDNQFKLSSLAFTISYNYEFFKHKRK